MNGNGHAIDLRFFLGTLLALSMASMPAHSALSRQEQRIVAAAEAETAPRDRLARELVNINSGTMNTAGVEQVDAS